MENRPVPPQYAVQIAAYEAELDQIHPPDQHSKGWRGKGDFNHKPEETYKRIKYLLKRRSMLYDGDNREVVLHPGSHPGQWFAHPASATNPERLPEVPATDANALIEALQDPMKLAAIQVIVRGQ